ncbi:cell wall integrity and stress response component 4-like [Elysia marginata]|uniref:Cell wall integrity and stress response component 4-like n=1 Tax=Elysia marginata TaxID=1093978 RepID=A0AAV4HJR3_9GAST|nr:cell wall integrity and stress response component 4-like [Elysia marginata]
MAANTVTYVLLLCACALTSISGHGRLRDPAGRSSMWRDGFDTARNYMDNQLNCGGRRYQWEVRGGKCGVCGDPLGKPQRNQPPGIYARPILAKCYDLESGSRYIDAHVELTANHLGYMQFRLCANNDFTKPVTQDCLDENLLQISSRNGKRIGKTLKLNSRHVLDINVKLRIPDNLTCSQCVLQWSYVTGKNPLHTLLKWCCVTGNTS